MSQDGKRVEVVFPYSAGAETMWADDLGNGTFRLDNVPLFAYGISYGDIFSIRLQDGDPRPYFDSVVKTGGNETYRVKLHTGFSPDDRHVGKLLDKIKSFSSVTSQHGTDRFSYTISASEDLVELENLLDACKAFGYWQWENSAPSG
jgi:hypothetical protein